MNKSFQKSDPAPKIEVTVEPVSYEKKPSRREILIWRAEQFDFFND